jgi:hypothetical protein
VLPDRLELAALANEDPLDLQDQQAKTDSQASPVATESWDPKGRLPRSPPISFSSSESSARANLRTDPTDLEDHRDNQANQDNPETLAKTGSQETMEKEDHRDRRAVREHQEDQDQTDHRALSDREAPGQLDPQANQEIQEAQAIRVDKAPKDRRARRDPAITARLPDWLLDTSRISREKYRPLDIGLSSRFHLHSVLPQSQLVVTCNLLFVTFLFVFSTVHIHPTKML